MRGEGRTTTLADVRVGASAVLASTPSLDPRQARRLVELGLRPGATVRVMMRTAGGGRVLGVDNLRIVLDRSTLGSIPVALLRAGSPPRSRRSRSAAAMTGTPVAASPGPGTAGDGTQGRGGRGRVARIGRDGRPRPSIRGRLRLLRTTPGLTVLPGEPLGEGTD